MTTELYLITMEVTLCFGPFNSLEAADEWRLALEREHKVIEEREGFHEVEAFGLAGFPTVPSLYTCASTAL